MALPLLSLGWVCGGKYTHIAALRAEEMSHVPLGSTRNNNFPLDRRLTALTPRTEELMIIQVAIKPQPLIAILLRRARYIIVPRHAITDAVHAVQAMAFRLGVESHALKALAAMVAAEAFWVEAYACGGDDAACDREGACAA